MNLQPEFFHLNFFNLYMFKSAVEKYYESNVFSKKIWNEKPEWRDIMRREYKDK